MANFTRKIFKNGITLIFEKRNLPVVTIIFAVKNGTINEYSHEKGISHFIEHMLYKGTKKRTSLRIAEDIEKNGGILNGFTNETSVAVWCKVPSEHIMKGLDVLSDMVKNSVFDENEFRKERKVIIEELKMRKDNPHVYALDKSCTCLYEKPFGKNDDEKTMNSITRKKLIGRFTEVFQPENLILCVVGKADAKDVEKFVNENFHKKMGKKRKFEIRKKNQTKIEKRKGIEQASLVLSFHVPNSRNKKSYAAIVLNSLMAEGLSSRLFVEIREKRNLAYNIRGICDISRDFGNIMVYVGTKRENVKEVKKLILKEFEKVSLELTDDEIKSVKRKIIGNHKISMEDSEEQAINLLFYEIQGNASEFYNFEKNIENVKLTDVKNLALGVSKSHSFFALVPS